MLVNIKIEVIVHTTKHEEEEEEEVEIEDASSLQSHRIQNCSMKITPSAVMHPGEGGGVYRIWRDRDDRWRGGGVKNP